MDPADRLRPYVAGIAVDWLSTMPDVRHRRIDGSLAFVDISGFTTLTERLAAKGKVGAEEMSDLLNASFATLLAEAYAYGALLVKWGGDAVLLLYEGPEHAALAARASYEMQRTMRRIGRLHTSVGTVQLKMSVGVHSGSFDFFLVGETHHELLVAGPAATETAVMEQIAEAGEVVVSAQTAALLPPRCVGAPKDGGFLLRMAPAADPRSRWWPPSSSGVDIGTCLDSAIRDHLLTEVGESEHRQVAVGFVEVSGVDDLLARQGPGAVAHALHEVISIVQAECAHHRVTFWETDISKDGFKILLIAGAPRSSGHDEDGMLRATRAILDRYDGPVRVRIGVNSGRVFNGGFGPTFRRTWSVKGDAVNLAARVMGKAESGQLLATESLLRRVGIRLEADLLPPFLVKGKKHPVQAAVVRAVTGERVQGAGKAGTFVGRRAEMDALMDASRGAARGHGSAISVLGEPGIGKSRLVDHVCSRLGSETRVLRGFADNYESATPYYAVRRLLLAAIGLPPGVADERVEGELRDKVACRAPGLAPWLPLLAVPFGLQLPETAETAAVQEQFRRPRTLSLVVDLLDVILTGPTVFVVDDAHDADDASAELLARLAAVTEGRPWLVLLVGRRTPAAVSEHGAIRELVVPPLAADDARALVLETSDGERFAPHLIRAIVERAEGNPLFLHELAVAVARSEEAELPSTLEEVLAAQIDELAPDARRLLRSVSVLGIRFDETLTTELLDRSPTRQEWQALDHFLAKHADGSRRFRTGLARDAAYEGLPFRRRIELHGRVAALLKRRATADEDHAEALSLHCLAAQQYHDACWYSTLAGNRASQLHANSEALTFLGRAVVAARKLDSFPADKFADLYETMGDLYARLAEIQQATASYRLARSCLPSDASTVRARLALSIALVRARAGSTATSLRWLTTAEHELKRGVGDGQAAVAALRGRVLVERAFIRHVQGRETDASRLCRAAIEVAEGVGAHDVVGRALHLSDLVALSAGERGSDETVERALRLFEQVADLPRQAGAWNHLGIRTYYAGEWDLAVERYAQARAVHERSGDEWSAAISAANIAEILVDQGRLAEAEPMVTAALQVWRASGTPSDIGFGAALLGRLRCRQGRVAEGLALLSEALEAYASKNQRFDLVDVQLRIVESLLLQAATDAALDRLDETERMLRAAARAARMPAADSIEHNLGQAVPFAADVQWLRGVALAQLGDVRGARDAVMGALETARTRSAHDVMRCLDALLWLETGTHEAEKRERDELRDQLGVVWTPTFPRTQRPVGVDLLALLPRQRVASVVPV